MIAAVTRQWRSAMRTSVQILALLLVGLVSVAHAAEFHAGSLDISGPYSRATPKGASIAAGYVTIKNTGTTVDRLIGGSSDAAAKFEVHEMSMDNGIMKMRPIKGGLEIKPGETVELKPQGLHIMFVGLKKPLKQGDHLKVTLQFEKAGRVNVSFDVQGVGAQAPGGGDHSGHMMKK